MILGTVAGAMAGLKEGDRVMAWKYGGEESRATLNAINMLGYADAGRNVELSKEIWSGKVKAVYADTKGYGEYKVGGSSITLSSKLLGGGKEGSAKLATVLAHEGTHYYGNRVEGIAHLQGLTTYNILKEMPGKKGDSSFADEMADAIRDKNSWKENSGDTDYWKLVKQKGGSYAASIADTVGQKRSEELLGKKITGIDDFSDDVISSVAGYSKEYITELRKTTPAALDQIYNSSKSELIGESLLFNAGYTYSKESGWSAANADMSQLQLTLNKTMGYISFGTEEATGRINDRFVVTSELYRNVNSWSGKTYGISEYQKDLFDTVGPSSKEEKLHSQIYTKYDLTNNLIDTFGANFPVQTVDVLNTKDKCGIDRNQPYYLFGHGWTQGNTVNSDFS